MLLSELMRASADATASPAALPRDPVLSGLTLDSRKVKPGFLFAALAGARQDGAAFVADAVERGAVAILAAFDAELPPLDPAIVVVRASQSAPPRGADGRGLRRPAARHHRRRHRHQRQVLDRALRAPDLGRRLASRPRASARSASSRRG